MQKEEMQKEKKQKGKKNLDRARSLFRGGKNQLKDIFMVEDSGQLSAVRAITAHNMTLR
jgi:hypothetical protein